MARATIPTIQEINRLYEKGDIDALRQLNEKLAKRANQRLKELEKRDMETAAYTRAKGFIEEYKELGSGRNFSRKKSLDIDDLFMNIKEESKFLRSQTSTVSGEMKRRNRIFDALTTPKNGEPIISVPEDQDREEYKKKFLDFLDTDVWSEIKKSLYADTNITMDEAGEAIAAGASVDELVSAYNDYLNGETDTDIFEMWDNWRSPL